MGKPKTHTVYESAAQGIADVLEQATADEPAPTHGAPALVEDAIRAGPLTPVPDFAGLPTLPGGGGGPVDLAGTVPPTSPREAAENLVNLGFALVPSGDWQPDNEAERDELITAVERVFVYRGIAPSLPPELALIAIVGKYGRKRMAKPAVRARVGPWLARFPLVGKLMGQGQDGGQAAAETEPGAFGGLPRMTPPHDGR